MINMMKRFFKFFLAAGFPWLILLFHDNPGGAIVALIMQATLIGWIPASVWAWRTMQEAEKAGEEHQKKSEKK